MRTSADRPLTDTQERALIALDDANGEWITNPARSVQTLDVLRDLGLCEYRFRSLSGDYPITMHWSPYEARITDEGRAMLATMGD